MRAERVLWRLTGRGCSARSSTSSSLQDGDPRLFEQPLAPGPACPGRPAASMKVDSICISAASNGAVRVVLDLGRVGSDTTGPGWSLQRTRPGFRRLESLRGRPGARTALHRRLHRYPGPRSRAWLWSRDGTHAPRCLQADQGQPSRLVREMTRGTGEGFSFRTTPHFGRAIY